MLKRTQTSTVTVTGFSMLMSFLVVNSLTTVTVTESKTVKMRPRQTPTEITTG